MDIISPPRQSIFFKCNCPAYHVTIRTHLEKAGTPIGPNDFLIAAHALALDCTLVTDNEAEFLRVPGLRVENWLVDTGA